MLAQGSQTAEEEMTKNQSREAKGSLKGILVRIVVFVFIFFSLH